MEYHFYSCENIFCSFDCVKGYITAYYGTKKFPVAEISFNDDNYKVLLDAINKETHIEELTILGDDGYIYNVTFNGVKRLQKAEGLSKNKIIKNQIKLAKEYQSDIAYKEKIFSSYEPNTINKTGCGALGYNKYAFTCKAYNRVIPFRFRKAKNSNQPLVIYFAGAGTIGHDNFRSFFEQFTIGKSLELLKADCNVLVPQYTRDRYFSEEDAREHYIEACTQLMDKLLDNSDIDKNRIYIYGASLGGGAVWNMLVNHSDRITAAVETMGCYYGYKKFDEIDFEAIAKVPIWMVHASDDSVVTIESDDKFYEKLKNCGCDIKYTRTDKYGHKAAGRFLSKEPWVKWMMSQKP